jgi:glycerol-3-phosphate O-acyltransferase
VVNLPIMSERSPAPPPAPAKLPRFADPFSAMTPRFNLFFRWFGKRFFGHFDLDDDTVARLRDLESRGSVVYVMRYASRLDYFLFNTLFLREGLRLSGFANGVRFYYYRPLVEAIRLGVRRLRELVRERRADGQHGVAIEEREHARELARAAESQFLFLRTARLRSYLWSRRQALEAGKQEIDDLGEIVRAVWTEDRTVFLVPLALFWRKGPRAERRFLNLTYGGPTRPSDLAKVIGFLTTYQGLFVKVGEPIDLRAFIHGRRHEGESAVTRKVRRSLLIFLYREEKVVEGPTLRPAHKVQESVLGDAHVRAAVEKIAVERGIAPEAAWGEAEKIFREIAAHMNSTFLAVLNVVVGSIFKRLFGSIDVNGLEKVAEYAKHHPLVLVPSHRSYFDFLILSWLFYRNHLVPPHILARENMGFGPFGYIFRRAGAFFMRSAFDDPLYKEVFRRYVAYLVKEGFTQEFFIEGGRSRTGKTLAPRLGMLSWDVEAFLAGSRRDLFFVPIAINYERLVEEGAMVDELEGGRKVNESTLGLLRARKYLRRRFGSVFLNFGEPISLADAIGADRAAFAASATPEIEAAKRRFVEGLGNRIVERINWATVANATSVAASALLGEPSRGMFRHDLVARMHELVELLHLQDVRLTPALERDRGDFREAVSFLVRTDLLHSVQDPRGEILFFEEAQRRALDFYRNGILHFLVTPSFMARRLVSGATSAELREDVGFWLDLFYQEFFVPRGELMASHVEAFLDYFERHGVLDRRGDRLETTEKGVAYFSFLAEQTRGMLEAYYAAIAAVLAADEVVTGRRLSRAIEEQFERAQILGEVARREAANPVTFGNALDVLVRRRALDRTRAEGGRDSSRDSLYTRGPAFEELRGLHARLAAALGAR